jgi:hypothetical protein
MYFIYLLSIFFDTTNAILSKKIKKDSNNIAYITSHIYTANTPVSSLSCSDGVNGLINKYGIYTLETIFPGVMAADFISWNSPLCGSCVQLIHNDIIVYSRVVDGCGKFSTSETHFDLDPISFNTLLGNQGIADGHGYATWNIVDSNLCSSKITQSLSTTQSLYTSRESTTQSLSSTTISTTTELSTTQLPTVHLPLPTTIINNTFFYTYTSTTISTSTSLQPPPTTSPTIVKCTIGQMKCNNYNFQTCVYDQQNSDSNTVNDNNKYPMKWINQECPLGTKCKQIENTIICDFIN